ncbi:MAG: Hsp20/alpha crystallin family protein [Desulfobulbaceae bacterium]|nr:Hsp20/alpha crystallin family protein [Desulfobulbaceae bacterium]
MNSLNKKLLKELEEMQLQTGRMLRNMSIARMMSPGSSAWNPPVDIYESRGEFCVYVDLAGADKESLSVIAADNQLRFYGTRQLPAKRNIDCVHHLEIELGSFDRTIILPGNIEVDEVKSTYADGILTIILPKKKRKDKVNITISTGE